MSDYFLDHINGRQITVLLAEDDDGHAELVRQRLEDSGIKNPIFRFKNGLEAWNFLSLKGDGIHRQAGQSYLLLLDIRMPFMDGIELLKRVKSDAKLRTIPIIMLTTSNDPDEVRACYEFGCSSYIAKPVSYQQFTEMIKRLGQFIKIIQVPSISDQG